MLFNQPFRTNRPSRLLVPAQQWHQEIQERLEERGDQMAKQYNITAGPELPELAIGHVVWILNKDKHQWYPGKVVACYNPYPFTMAPKKSSEGNKNKRKAVRATIEVKKQLIAKHEGGMRVMDLAAMFEMPKSTVCTILKNKEVIKAADVAKGVTTLTPRRSKFMEEMEKLLLVWINEKQLVGAAISEGIICEKAKLLHGDLIKDLPGSSADDDEFKASRGWFEKFKRRSGIHSVVMHGEAASSNKDGAADFVNKFSAFVNTEGYVAQQVFNCDETGLFWKKMPRRTYIMKEEKSVPGHKPMKDRLTLLLCANASGDCKIKPLLVYHSENPRVFKKNNVIKSKLNVMWRANVKAWATRQFFTEWIHEEFAPSVKAYLEEKNLPLKALLVMDNAPAHPPGLEEDLEEEYSFIKVKFLPPNTTPLIQPMDQQVISNFKKLYTKAMFQRCFEVTNETELTLRDFWKDHYNILHCLRIIDKAWREVSLRTMNSAWKKLWPDCVAGRDFEGFEEPIVPAIVALGQSMGLEVSEEDVEELVEDHNKELTTEELQHLHKMQQEEMAVEISSEEEEGASVFVNGLVPYLPALLLQHEFTFCQAQSHKAASCVIARGVVPVLLMLPVGWGRNVEYGQGARVVFVEDTVPPKGVHRSRRYCNTGSIRGADGASP
uniref:tigger transposable element-derived protein 1-like n=1 Tax=Myxine glutinosa TaxID=7769 RepID=UPI00358F173F